MSILKEQHERGLHPKPVRDCPYCLPPQSSEHASWCALPKDHAGKEARKLQVRRLVLSEGAANLSGDPGRGSGIRPGGLLAPPSESTGELTVIGGKGDKDRTVQFGSRLHGLLQELLFLEPMAPNDGHLDATDVRRDLALMEAR